jgi:outer membrane protein
MLASSFKQLAIALFFCLSLFALAPRADAQIAYVDMEQIIENMPDYKRVKSELESYQKILEEQIQAEEKKMMDYYAIVVQRLRTDYISPAQMREYEAKLQKMQEDLQKKALDADKQIVQKEAALTKPLYDKFNAALKAVAVANGYNYIFDKKMMLYSDGGVDATAKLKAQLGIP